MSSDELFESILVLMDRFYDYGEMHYTAYDSLWNSIEAYAAKCIEECADKEEK